MKREEESESLMRTLALAAEVVVELQSTTSVAEDLDRVGIWGTERRE